MQRVTFDYWLERLTSHYLDNRSNRKSLFLSGFLALTFGMILLLSLGNLAGYLINGSVEDLNYFIQDLATIPLLIILLIYNFHGHVTAVSYLYVSLMVTGIALTFPVEDVQSTLLIYVLPIIAAGFTIRPKASFLVAGVCFIIYSLICLTNPHMLHTNMLLLSCGGMASIAVITWFLSDRFERVLVDAQESKSKYVTLLEKNPSCVYMVAGSQIGRWEYASPRIFDLLGFQPTEWLGDSHRWMKQIHPDDRQPVMETMAHTLAFGLPMHAEYRMLHQSGKVVWVSDDAIPIRTPGQPERVQGVLLDISAHKRTEQVQVAVFRISQAAFEASELTDLYANIHAILGGLMPAENFFIALHDAETNQINFPYFVDQYDQPPDPIQARNGLTEYVLRTGKPLFASPEKFSELAERGEINGVGTPCVDWLGVPLVLNQATIGVMAVQSYTEGVRFTAEEMDILRFVSTQVAMVIDRKRTESQLHELSQLNSEVISGVKTGIVVYDRNLKHLIWNRYLEQMTGLQEDSLLGLGLDEVFPLFRENRLPGFFENALAGESVAIPDLFYNIEITGKSGWINGFAGPHRNAQGEIVGVIGVINDITERKKDEEAIRAALLEKEVLLREIHHRVKNNLQVMSSLLSLQIDAITDPGSRGILQEMLTRIRSMALIHEELYRSQELSRVNFAEYIQKLASALRQTYLLNSNTALVVDVEEVFLGVDTAIPCGLVISELVTNAFKYAYPDGKGGEILIKLRGCAPGLYQLSVSDQGIGLPSDFDIQQSETLGLQLVTILIRQLRATLQVKRTGGTDFQIEFSELKRGDRVGNSH